ncbi:MAG: DUF2244 domain-containing protein [Alphaproteobacteria bacterium]
MSARAPYLDIILWPNPPLGRKGLKILFGFAAFVSFVISSFFFAMGAWPIVGFLGLDLAGLYVAFRVIERRSRVREYVRLDQTDLTIRHESPQGAAHQARLEPVFARVDLEQQGHRHNRLYLRDGPKRYEIGQFLCADEKTALAQEIKSALAAWRNPYA